MINYDKRDLITILKGNREGKLILSKNLYFEFSKLDNTKQSKIVLYYKEQKMSKAYFFTETKDLDFLINDVSNKMTFVFHKFTKKSKLFENDKEYIIIEKFLSFIIKKNVFHENKNCLIKCFNELVIISLEYDDNNRQIFLLSLKNDRFIYRFAKIKDESLKTYSVYNPYEFILKHKLFYDFAFYNELAIELSYETTN